MNNKVSNSDKEYLGYMYNYVTTFGNLLRIVGDVSTVIEDGGYNINLSMPMLHLTFSYKNDATLTNPWVIYYNYKDILIEWVDGSSLIEVYENFIKHLVFYIRGMLTKKNDNCITYLDMINDFREHSYKILLIIESLSYPVKAEEHKEAITPEASDNISIETKFDKLHTVYKSLLQATDNIIADVNEFSELNNYTVIDVLIKKGELAFKQKLTLGYFINSKKWELYVVINNYNILSIHADTLEELHKISLDISVNQFYTDVIKHNNTAILYHKNVMQVLSIIWEHMGQQFNI